MISLDEFIKKWTGKTVDTDGIYPNQCMDLMHQYLIDCFDITDPSVLAAESAYLSYQNIHSNGKGLFEVKTLDGLPQKGDIVFFGKQVGEYGHVCIYVKGDAKNFKSFDANWPIGSLPHIQDHTFSGVIGWIRCIKDTDVNVHNTENMTNNSNENKKWIDFTFSLDKLKDKGRKTYYEDDPKRIVDDLLSREQSISQLQVDMDVVKARLEYLETHPVKEVIKEEVRIRIPATSPLINTVINFLYDIDDQFRKYRDGRSQNKR